MCITHKMYKEGIKKLRMALGLTQKEFADGPDRALGGALSAHLVTSAPI